MIPSERGDQEAVKRSDFERDGRHRHFVALPFCPGYNAFTHITGGIRTSLFLRGYAEIHLWTNPQIRRLRRWVKRLNQFRTRKLRISVRMSLCERRVLNLLDQFRAVWLVDFEFSAPPGERPTPVCLVAREYRSGRTIQIFQDDLSILRAPPYPVGPEDLFCAYYASAEVGCHLALGWPSPAQILDLYTEFRCLTNGLPTPNGWNLLGALLWFGLDAMSAVEKQS